MVDRLLQVVFKCAFTELQQHRKKECAVGVEGAYHCVQVYPAKEQTTCVSFLRASGLGCEKGAEPGDEGLRSG